LTEATALRLCLRPPWSGPALDDALRFPAMLGETLQSGTSEQKSVDYCGFESVNVVW
jgi:hypothetical protein